MLGINDFPKVLIQSGGSHMQHANPVQLFIHTHDRPAPNHKEFLRNPRGILLESYAFKCFKNHYKLYCIPLPHPNSHQSINR